MRRYDMVGDLGNETGSFPAAICGAVAGVGVWILGILAIDEGQILDLAQSKVGK